MAMYLVKNAEQRLMEVKSTAQLERLVVTGLLARDALVRTLPDGPWVRAEKHPDTARFFRADENERTMIAVSPALLRGGAPAGSDASATAEPASETFWIRTGVSTVEARGAEVVKRLFELGVVRAEHGVGATPQGPFVPLAEHPLLAEAVHQGAAASGAAPSGLHATASTRADVSVVIALSEEEIEYLQDEVSQKRAIASVFPGGHLGSDAPRAEVSNIIVLSGADLEIVEDELLSADLVIEVGPVVTADPDEPLDVGDHAVELGADDLEELVAAPDEPEIIELGADDIEEFEHIATGATLPALEGSWDEFCRAMNLAAQRIATRGSTQELTWDLFRSMMERPRTAGPSESSWNRFQDRLQGRRTGRTPLPTETTWDRFRELMTTPGQHSETTWSRFVRGIQTGRHGPTPGRRGRDIVRQGGQLIAGEARIKSDVVRIADVSGPKVRIEGLKNPSSSSSDD